MSNSPQINFYNKFKAKYSKSYLWLNPIQIKKWPICYKYLITNSVGQFLIEIEAQNTLY